MCHCGFELEAISSRRLKLELDLKLSGRKRAVSTVLKIDLPIDSQSDRDLAHVPDHTCHVEPSRQEKNYTSSSQPGQEVAGQAELDATFTEASSEVHGRYDGGAILGL